MTSRLEAVCLHAEDPAQLAGFWSTLLRREAVDSEGVVDLLPADDGLSCRLRFRPTDEPRPVGQQKLHLHLTTTSPADQQEVIDRALALGARHLDVGLLPEEGHVVLADPEGNAFCVIEPGSSFLAGCGFLGELACDGSRALGHFWSAVLDWPLVWDQDDETAVQAPYGGTKIAWGGGPELAPTERGGLHVDLTAPSGRPDEVARLVGLGATLVGDTDGWTVLTDPDGNTFRLADA
ncbi:VOC family protein [Nocardioides currus]|uniref:Bleomycin resistance protein n=1 Tax=Nocardioides currus TaxID=2133958 RepID=A0A2R7YUH1_9ACTN|nr:VOC family protein [Nocardioides currus]PUA80022.1 bleomycin resistance protein [Nocardioides currus]